MPLLQHFFSRFPVTSSIVLLNIAMFLLVQLGVLFPTYYVSFPGNWTVGTFLAHISHVEIFHIFINMFVLVQLGPLLEERLGSYGMAVSSIGIWLLSVFLMVPFLDAPTLGYSGILMGQLALLFMLFYHVPHIRTQLGFWLLLNVMIGLVPGISFIGHGAGAVSGFAVFWLLQFTER